MEDGESSRTTSLKPKKRRKERNAADEEKPKKRKTSRKAAGQNGHEGKHILGTILLVEVKLGTMHCAG